MTKAEIEKKVLRVVSGNFLVGPSRTTPFNNIDALIDDIIDDSIDFYELLLKLEDEFDCSFIEHPEHTFSRVKTVKDLAKVVEHILQDKAKNELH